MGGHEQPDRLADLTVALQTLTQGRGLLARTDRHQRDGGERCDDGADVGRLLGEATGHVREEVERPDLVTVEEQPVADGRAHGRLGDDPLGEPRPGRHGVGQVGVVLVGLVEDGVDAGPLAELQLDLVDAARDVVGARGRGEAVALAHEQRRTVTAADETPCSVDEGLVDRVLVAAGVDQRGQLAEGVVDRGIDPVFARHDTPAARASTVARTDDVDASPILAPPPRHATTGNHTIVPAGEPAPCPPNPRQTN